MKNIAVILAGGVGSRFEYDKPKQFIKVAGKLIIEHTLDMFQKHKKIDEIFIVCHKNYVSFMEDLVNKNNYSKVTKILNGGSTRNESSLSAIRACDNEDINLIFHDSVRPLVDEEIIDNCIEALKRYNAIDVAIPATDTIIEVENNIIVDIPDRDKLKRGQTPQGFKLKTIKKAYELALKDTNFKATDDCGVVRKYLPNEKIYVVKGKESNIKVTYKEDLYLLEKLFQLRTISINSAVDLKLLKDKVMVIFGGSYGIGADIKKIALAHGAKVYSFSRSENNVDVSNSENVKKALNRVYRDEKRIDYVINTAGILYKQPLKDMSYDKINELININYIGSIIIAKEAFSYLKDTKGALLLFTSSSYTRGRAFYSIYSSSKAAIVNFTQALADEWDSFGIKVNCINPERTLTPMRIRNFGLEDPSTLLSSKIVAEKSLRSLLLPYSGQVIDIKVDDV
jgi:2-C-methyl-D-erythritol 4-phosphate cytidylyltransferase